MPVDKKIICENCGWSWFTSQSDEHDKFVCHKCHHDNSSKYQSSEVTAKELIFSLPNELKNRLIKLWHIPQRKDYHPEGNTLKHVLMVINRAVKKYPDNKNIIAAALFHDIGKDKTFVFDEIKKHPTAYGHENVSAELVLKYSDWIKDYGADVETVHYIVKNHMKAHLLNQMRPEKRKAFMSHPYFSDLEKFESIDKGGINYEDGGSIDAVSNMANVLKGNPELKNITGIKTYRGQQIGQTGKWFTASKEFAQIFANTVKGKKKSNGEIIEHNIIGSVFDFPYIVTEYAKLSEKLGNIFGVTQKEMIEAISKTSPYLAESEIIRIHNLLENEGFQNLLSSKGVDYVKAREYLTKQKAIDTFIKINNKPQEQLIAEAYYKAKKDNSNPKLIKEVDNLLTPIVASKGKMLESENIINIKFGERKINPKKVIDTETLKEGDNDFGNAAQISDDGSIIIYHITDNNNLINVLNSGESIKDTYNTDDTKREELGSGIYGSAVPEYWANRSVDKYNFLNNLPKEKQNLLSNKIKDTLNLYISKKYITPSEYEYATKSVREYQKSGDWNYLLNTSRQPYNIRFWENEYLKNLGIENKKTPNVVAIKAKGNFIEFTDAPYLTKSDVDKIIASGIDGAFVGGGFVNNPELVIYNKEAIKGYRVDKLKEIDFHNKNFKPIKKYKFITGDENNISVINPELVKGEDNLLIPIVASKGNTLESEVEAIYLKSIQGFEDAGLNVIKGNISKNNFGNSAYFYIEMPNGTEQKIRVSDHSVTNINRLFNEIHIMNENDIPRAIEEVRNIINHHIKVEKIRNELFIKDKERTEFLNKKWEEIKDNFKNQDFGIINRTYDDLETFKRRFPHAKNIMQTSLDRGAYSYEYSYDKIPKELGKGKPSKDYIENYRYEKGGSISKKIAALKDRIHGSKINPAGTSSSIKSAGGIEFSENVLSSIKNKIDAHNKKYPNKKITLDAAKAVVRRGMGAYSSTHRPTIKGNKPNSRTAWGLARLNAFIYKVVHGKSASGKYSQDNDLLNELNIKHQKFEDGGSLLLAPNGKPSNLTPEQWKLVRTPEFKKWFGNWENDPENASKAVDDNGEPLVVYHGSNVPNINIFKESYDGGYWFTSKYEVAQDFAENNNMFGKKTIYIVFLNIKNPYINNLKGSFLEHSKDTFDTIREVMDGIDGIILKNALDYVENPIISDIYNCFEATQIKLADGTNTTFDGTNPDIRFERGGEANSGLLLAPNGNPSNLTPEQWKLVRTPEFKKWFGNWENDPENASKAIDENGEPKVVYHGSENKFFIFDVGLSGRNSGYKRTRRGTYFSSKKNVAETYIKKYKKNIYGGNTKIRDGVVYEVFLNLRSPNIIDGEGENISWWDRDIRNIEWNEISIKQNTEKGFIIKNVIDTMGDLIEYSDIYIAYKPEQIKLADGTNVTFDGSNPDMRFDGGGVLNYDGGYLKYTIDDENKEIIIDDIKVEIQRKGTGKRMIDKIKELSNELDYPITLYAEPQDDTINDDELRDFYLSQGFEYHPDDVDNKYFIYGSIRYAKGGLIAPNGKPSNLTPEQWKLVRTPEFKKWFGNWENDPENASKAVDDNGEPLVVYHGTNVEFYKFDLKYFGKTDKGWYGKGFYFTPNKNWNFSEDAVHQYGGKEVKLELFLNIKSPFYGQAYAEQQSNLVGAAKDSNMDGVIVIYDYGHEKEGKISEIVAFYPEQIKLANGTNTTFDGTNPDIRYAKGGKTKGGDCYYIAGQFALDEFKEKGFEYIGTPYLIHAEVQGQGKISNLRYGHAWVEDDIFVYDFSNGRELIIPKKLYYHIGDVNIENPKKYVKYTFKQAMEKMVETGNYGCWDLDVKYELGGGLQNNFKNIKN